MEICKIKQNKNGVAKLFLFNTFVCIALFSFEEKRTENSNFTTKHKSTELPGFLERTTGIQVLRMTLEVQTTLLLAAGWQNVYIRVMDMDSFKNQSLWVIRLYYNRQGMTFLLINLFIFSSCVKECILKLGRVIDAYVDLTND